MLNNVLKLIKISLFAVFVLPSSQAIAQYDIDGEWVFPEGISGASAKIRFNTVDSLIVAKLEIAGFGSANDFALVGELQGIEIPKICGDNAYISLCTSISFSSNSSATMRQISCDALPDVDADCPNPNGTLFSLERPVSLNLSGIWDAGQSEYFSVTHAADGSVTIDPLFLQGGKIYEDEVYTGFSSKSDGSGTMQGVSQSRNWVKDIEFISATDSEVVFKLTSCSGNCDSAASLIGVARIAYRIGDSPKYGR